MADMCGPSNALQSFQKHSTVDRTLQQDRLVSRSTPAQGFRSTPGPSAGLVDHEFEAFQAGQLPLHHGFQQTQPFSHAGPSLHQPGPVDWASDFQRLNVSSPPPQLSQNPFGPQVQQRQDGGWHQEFARQQSPMADQSVGQIPYQRYTPMSGMGMMNTQFGGNIANPQAETSIAQQKQPEEAFDEEAFARAFEEAAKAEMETREEVHTEFTQESSQGVELGQDIMIEESAERLMASENALLDQERIGADSIYDPVSEELHRDQEDPDALARTAGHLLESVRHEQSSKFQNSQFLELMRQFRDGHATVEGDKVVGMGYEPGGFEDGDEASKSAKGHDRENRELLAYLTMSLKKLVLDRDRPFQRSPENVQALLHLLLKMERALKGVDAETRAKVRVEKTLSAIITNPALKDMSSIIAQAQHTLTPDPLVAKANAQMEAFANDFKGELAQRYVAAELSGSHELLMESKARLLGYSLHPSLFLSDGTTEVRVHEERVSDILGMAVCRVLTTIEDRGFLCPELSTRSFFDLVEDYDRFLASRRKADYDAYVVAFVGVERDVESRVKRAADGWEVSGEGRVSGMQRLRVMREGRERRPFPGEEGWGKDVLQESESESGGEEEVVGSLGDGAKEIGKRDPSGHSGEMRGREGTSEEMRDRAEDAVGRVKTG